MEKSSERVVGEIAVTAKLPMGYEKLKLYFTDRRIIVGHLNKVGAGSVAPTFMFGSLGAALGGLFGRNKRVSGTSKSDSPSPGRILASHHDNFSISFDEIINVDLSRGPYKHSILLLSKSDKLDLTSQSRFDLLHSLFEKALGDKVRVHETNSRTPPSR